MPTYLLEDERKVTVPRAPVLISIAERSGAPLAEGIRLSARAGDQPASVLDAGPDQLVITSVSEPVIVAVVAASGTTVAESSEFAITATIEEGGADPTIVVLPSLRAAGLESMDVLEISADSDVLTIIRARRGSASLVLAGMARSAQVAARRVLGVDHLPQDQTLSPSLMVDGSASMLPWIDSGAIERAVSALVGVCDVVAPGTALTCQISGPKPRAVTATEPSELGAQVASELQAVPLSRHFEPGTTSFAKDGQPAVLYIVTDSVPAVLCQPGHGVSGIHLVIIGDPLAIEVQPDPGVPVTVVPEFGADNEWPPENLAEVVLSLTSPYSTTNT